LAIAYRRDWQDHIDHQEPWGQRPFQSLLRLDSERTQSMRTLIRTAAAATIATLAGPAAAQQVRYCNGNLVSNSFYLNV